MIVQCHPIESTSSVVALAYESKPTASITTPSTKLPVERVPDQIFSQLENTSAAAVIAEDLPLSTSQESEGKNLDP